MFNIENYIENAKKKIHFDSENYTFNVSVNSSDIKEQINQEIDNLANSLMKLADLLDRKLVFVVDKNSIEIFERF